MVKGTTHLSSCRISVQCFGVQSLSGIVSLSYCAFHNILHVKYICPQNIEFYLCKVLRLMKDKTGLGTCICCYRHIGTFLCLKAEWRTTENLSSCKKASGLLIISCLSVVRVIHSENISYTASGFLRAKESIFSLERKRAVSLN